MAALLVRAGVSGIIVALVALIARRSPAAGALVASLVIRDPFRGFFASGRITAYELVDVGDILGAVVSLTLAATAALAAWDVLDEERHWGRSLGIGS